MTVEQNKPRFCALPLERRVRLYGRKLTQQEIVEAIAATGEETCSACGNTWDEHHLTCEGSEEPYGPDSELPGMWENADFMGGKCDA